MILYYNEKYYLYGDSLLFEEDILRMDFYDKSKRNININT